MDYGPLQGVQVLDASRVLAGPYAAMMLGDLGADVIKIERPGSGDPTRAWGPPFQGGESAYYLSVNRNKRSLTLNLKSPMGRDLFLRMAARSDVVIENFLPGLGIEVPNPKLVWCSITGYGPGDERPAYDIALQAESGWMSITGEEGAPPTRIGVAVIDLFTAHFAAQAILAALFERERTGRGRRVDVSMFHCAVASLTYMGQSFLATGQAPRRAGSRHPSIAPYQAFATRDGGYIVVAVGSQEIWERFCRALGHPDWARDLRFANNARRVENRSALEAAIEPLFREKTTAEWAALLRSHDVPASPVNDLRDAFELGKRLAAPIDHPTIGRLSLISPPLAFGSTRRPPPRLGEHTDEILRELGVAPVELKKLRAEGVV